jgi:hypothetical protein
LLVFVISYCSVGHVGIKYLIYCDLQLSYAWCVHIARAVLESMCFQVNDVLSSMHKDVGEAG